MPYAYLFYAVFCSKELILGVPISKGTEDALSSILRSPTVRSLVLYKELIFGVPILQKDASFRKRYPLQPVLVVVLIVVVSTSVSIMGTCNTKFPQLLRILCSVSCCRVLRRHMTSSCSEWQRKYPHPAPNQRNELLVIFSLSRIFVDSKKNSSI
jgi:hypothetical protein